MRPYVESALARMSPVSAEEYYSLCGRLDTLEHVHEVLLTVAAELAGAAVPAADDGADDDGADADTEGPPTAPAADPVVN